jgi:hypothetical protein
VIILDRYTPIFFIAIVPYAAGIVNFLGYPPELDGERRSRGSLRAVARHLGGAIRASVRRGPLGRLLLESMGFEGMFRASKDYLQPVLKGAALSLGAALALPEGLGEPQRAALLVGPVYFGLYLVSAAASRKAHRLKDLWGGEDRAARRLWGAFLGVFVVLVPAMILGSSPVMIAGFVALFVLQNAWRPILMARIDSLCEPAEQATILSIENQAKSLSTMLLAPALGALVDLVGSRGLGGPFWPVGAFGLALGMIFVLWHPKDRGCQ